MLKWLGIILFLTLLLTCAITPAIYSLIISLWPDFSYPFSRVYNRVLLVNLILFLLLFRRKVNLSEIISPFKHGDFKLNIGWLAKGCLLSFVLSLSASLLLLYSGEVMLKEFKPQDLLHRILKTVPTALIVSFIEEGIFRIVIFVSFIRYIGIYLAAIFSSFIYAVVHFITPDRSFEYPGFSLSIGFEYLAVVFERLMMPGVVFGVIGLFLIGIVLCFAFVRSGSIYLSIGLHMGWIFISKLTSVYLVFQPVAGIPSGLGSRYFLVAQPLAWLSIVVVGAALFFLSRKVSDEQESKQ